jgi:acetamidase/formamidase
LTTGDWGWTAVSTALGLLKDEIPGPHIKTFDIRSQEHAVFKRGEASGKPKVRIPCQPFYGAMGVAPASEDEDLNPLFPRNDIGDNFLPLYRARGFPERKAYMLLSCAGNLKAMRDLGLELYTISASIRLGLFVD